MSTDDPSFFERERERLAGEITSGFEELLSSSNLLNRKLEELLGMTHEYGTIATLWSSYYELMRGSSSDTHPSTEDSQAQGLPGTGGHVVAAAKT